MEASLAGFTAPEIAGIIEARWFWFREVLARLPGAKSGREEELTWVITGLPSAALNVVLGGRFRPEGLEAGLEATLDRFRRRGLPLTWWLGPSAAALAEARSRGCRLAVLQATAQGRRLYLGLGFREHCRLIPFRWPA